MVRSQALYEAVIDYLDAVAGPKNELQIAAIQRARGIEPVQLTQMPGTFESRILNLFQHVYPEKAVKAGGEALESVIHRATAIASKVNFDRFQGFGASVLAMLMFGFGHCVAEDPLYPWVADAIAAGSPSRPAEGRVELLTARSKAYLDAMLKTLTRD
jgi:hypothetical protein